MPVPNETLILLLVILGFGLIIPELFRKFKLPSVTSLILVGAILGPHMLGYLKTDPVIDFFGFFGSTFLLLMAGLEVKTQTLVKFKSKILIMAAGNSIIPFFTGLLIVKYFGYSWATALIVGTMFISSAAAIVMGSLKDSGLMKTKIGRSIATAAVIEDVASLLIFALILQKISPIVNLSLPAYFLALLGAFALFKFAVPWLTEWLDSHITVHKEDEDQLRLIIVMLLAALIFFTLLGVHALIAAFIVGVFLSHNITSEKLYNKLHTLGYGLFVPVFFVVIGMEMDLSIFFRLEYTNLILFSIILSLIGAKIISGYVSARLAKFSSKNALLYGVASIPLLTTTLAITYAASEMMIIDDVILTSILLLTIITSIASPLLVKAVSRL